VLSEEFGKMFEDWTAKVYIIFKKCKYNFEIFPQTESKNTFTDD